MQKTPLIQRIFVHLGENNHPSIAVATVAAFKGIFRPIFTMSDKKEDPETKKYAAIREGVTELIAIPAYVGAGMLAEKISPVFLDSSVVKDGKLSLNKENRAKFDDILRIKTKMKKEGKPADAVNKAFDNAVNALGNEKVLFNNYKRAKMIVGQTGSFLGVCTAALLIIPGVCNFIMPRVMKHFKPAGKPVKKTNPTDNTTQLPARSKHNVFKAYGAFTNTGGMGGGLSI